jgi:hypothetical protein
VQHLVSLNIGDTSCVMSPSHIYLGLWSEGHWHAAKVGKALWAKLLIVYALDLAQTVCCTEGLAAPLSIAAHPVFFLISSIASHALQRYRCCFSLRRTSYLVGGRSGLELLQVRCWSVVLFINDTCAYGSRRPGDGLPVAAVPGRLSFTKSSDRFISMACVPCFP